MAITYGGGVTTAAAAQATTTTPTVSTAAFTPAVGDVIVVVAGGGGQSVIPASCASTGQSLTWTQRATTTTTASTAPAKLFTATATSTASMTVDVTYTVTTNDVVGIVAMWFSGAQLAATPATGSITGDTTTPWQTTLTSTGTNSVVAWADVDYLGQAGTVTFSPAATAGPRYVNSANVVVTGAYQAAAAAGTQTFGMTAPTGQKASILGIELQVATAPPASPRPVRVVRQAVVRSYNF